MSVGALGLRAWGDGWKKKCAHLRNAQSSTLNAQPSTPNPQHIAAIGEGIRKGVNERIHL